MACAFSLGTHTDSPQPVQDRGDLEYSVGHGVAHIIRVLVQEHCSGLGHGGGPLLETLDAIVALSEPLEANIGDPTQIVLGPRIQSPCSAGAMCAGMFEVLPIYVGYGVGWCLVYVVLVLSEEAIHQSIGMFHIAIIYCLPGLSYDGVYLIGVGGIGALWMLDGLQGCCSLWLQVLRGILRSLWALVSSSMVMLIVPGGLLLNVLQTFCITFGEMADLEVQSLP